MPAASTKLDRGQSVSDVFPVVIGIAVVVGTGWRQEQPDADTSERNRSVFVTHQSVFK